MVFFEGCLLVRVDKLSTEGGEKGDIDWLYRMKRIIFLAISLYGKFSFFFLPSCRFYPSCSQYALQTIEKHGLFLGLIKALRRILRCQAFSPGGYDPV